MSVTGTCEACGAHDVVSEINGRLCDIDHCIAPIVFALNNAGMPTVASCCGHRRRHGRISLRDGRELIVAPDFDYATRIDEAFGDPIHEPDAHARQVMISNRAEVDDLRRDRAMLMKIADVSEEQLQRAKDSLVWVCRRGPDE